MISNSKETKGTGSNLDICGQEHTTVTNKLYAEC
jgi:hypothetical protein